MTEENSENKGPSDGDVGEAKKTDGGPPDAALVEVCVNGERIVKVHRGVYTTEELIVLLGIPEGHVVNIVEPNGEFNELTPGEKVTIARKTDVVSQPPTGGAA